MPHPAFLRPGVIPGAAYAMSDAVNRLGLPNQHQWASLNQNHHMHHGLHGLGHLGAPHPAMRSQHSHPPLHPGAHTAIPRHPRHPHHSVSRTKMAAAQHSGSTYLAPLSSGQEVTSFSTSAPNVHSMVQSHDRSHDSLEVRDWLRGVIAADLVCYDSPDWLIG